MGKSRKEIDGALPDINRAKGKELPATSGKDKPKTDDRKEPFRGKGGNEPKTPGAG